jgi:hypothetical protein
MASTAAEALDAGRVDFLDGELARYQGRLDVLALRLADVCDRLSVGVNSTQAMPMSSRAGTRKPNGREWNRTGKVEVKEPPCL